LKVTSKNLSTRKKQCIELAKKVAKTRDGYRCRTCGRTDRQMHGSHIIPVSRNWFYAVDVGNIICQCARCHMEWHESPVKGVAILRDKCRDVWEYTSALHYPTTRITVSMVQDTMTELQRVLSEYERKG